MRAVVYQPDAPAGLVLGEAPEPAAGSSQSVVRVAAASLNFADIAFLRKRQAPGAVPGFDASGVVLSPAADGAGPPTGTRVATFGYGGAWAALRAVESVELAEVPEAVDLVVAAATAGVTALRALRRLGPVVGRRVLITGASGGVGRFAVQLAARAGAHVVASVGDAARAEGLATLGAAEVVVGLDGVSEPLYGALDNVGGDTLAAVYARLEPGGVVQAIGSASLRPTSIDFEEARMRGGARIEAFTVGAHLGRDLRYLLELVAAGELDPQVDWRGPWAKVADAADALRARTVRGKAILEVSA